jgi:hypothetical protein
MSFHLVRRLDIRRMEWNRDAINKTGAALLHVDMIVGQWVYGMRNSYSLLLHPRPGSLSVISSTSPASFLYIVYYLHHHHHQGYILYLLRWMVA